jgi:hypothetical protein
LRGFAPQIIENNDTFANQSAGGQAAGALVYIAQALL